MAMDVLGEDATYDKLQLHIIEEEHRQQDSAEKEAKAVALLAHLASSKPDNTRRKPMDRQDDKNIKTSVEAERCGYCRRKGHEEEECRLKIKHKKEDGDVSENAVIVREGMILWGQAMFWAEHTVIGSTLTWMVDSAAS